MDWMKILSALFLGIMLIWLLPRAKHVIKNSPKGTADDWKSAIFPLLMVVLFVLFLMSVV